MFLHVRPTLGKDGASFKPSLSDCSTAGGGAAAAGGEEEKHELLILEIIEE